MHEAGEERRLGATPATATPLTSSFMFERMSGASEGRGAVRGKARGPAVGAKRRLPGPGKTKVTSAGGWRLSPRSGRQARPGGVEGAPAGRTGAGVNRPTVRPRNAAPAGDCNREGGRGNTEAVAVHKAGEERRFGATPATATPLPYSSRRSGDSVLIFRFGHTRRCPRLRALRVPGLAGTAPQPATEVLTFRFGDKLSRPRLRPLRSPELAGTARRSGWFVGFRISSGARQGGADVNRGGAWPWPHWAGRGDASDFASAVRQGDNIHGKVDVPP